MEAAIKREKENAVDPSLGYGSLVSIPTVSTLMSRAHGIFDSAGICAAVKTSKVPITVKAKTDITCKYRQQTWCYFMMADTLRAKYRAAHVERVSGHNSEQSDSLRPCRQVKLTASMAESK